MTSRLAALLLAAAWLVSPAVQAVDAGVTPTEIRLGASAVLSGPLGPQTRDYGEGSRLYFEHVNAQGGVHGRRIRYITLDDGFDVERAVANTRQLLLEDKVFLIYNNTGTAHTAAILPLLEETRTVAFGPVTGATSLRERFHRHLFHVRASYANEARRIASQLQLMGITRVVSFHQDDVFGRTLAAEIRHAAQQEGLSIAAQVKVDAKQPDFAAAARQAHAAQPQAVIMGTAGTTFPRFVKALHALSSRPTFYGFSVASLDVIHRELGQDAQGIVLAQIMPSLRQTSNPAVRDYLKLLRQRGGDARPSASQFEGFVHARLLVEGLRRAGPLLTTDSFIKAMETAGDIGFDRFTARYGPRERSGFSYVELAIVDATGQLRY